MEKEQVIKEFCEIRKMPIETLRKILESGVLKYNKIRNIVMYKRYLNELAKGQMTKGAIVDQIISIDFNLDSSYIRKVFNSMDSESDDVIRQFCEIKKIPFSSVIELLDIESIKYNKVRDIVMYHKFNIELDKGELNRTKIIKNIIAIEFGLDDSFIRKLFKRMDSEFQM